MNIKTGIFACSFALTLGILGCAGGEGGADGSSALPPIEAFAIPSPAQSQSQAQSQALCSTGTDAIDAIEDVIDAENGALADDRALIEATLEASPSEDAGIYTYEAEISGRTLSIDVTTDGESAYAFTGTLTDDEGEHDYLDGAMANDGNQGTLSITPPGEDALSVSWSETSGTLAFVRKIGSKNTTFSQNDVAIDIVTDDAVIHWSLEDFSGMLVGDGLPLCFEGGESASDFCDVDCSSVDLSDLGL